MAHAVGIAFSVIRDIAVVDVYFDMTRKEHPTRESLRQFRDFTRPRY